MSTVANATASVNLRELRNTKQLKAWLKAGKTVELRERDTVLARIVPESVEKKPVEWPDFEARRKAIFGIGSLRRMPCWMLVRIAAFERLSRHQCAFFLVYAGSECEGR